MNRAAQQGFTLLEMIVVLVIIGMLMGLVGPRLFSQADKAKAQTADTQVKMLKGALLTMRLDIGWLPTEEEGLALLNTPPSDERLGAFWHGPYLEGGVPLDPWNRPYLYSDRPSAEQPFTLYSQGADGQPGGKGLDADVGYAPKR
ncbi:type II secretion system major pseudopilin GspG [Pseudomonas aeruginosa]|uniref:type II secretion system major pseudopilin GspG n=1 Tax=Pseudomonas aeruginosa TaxID=287 RepID=UPI00217E73C9|nr:type II secretion system major pseudopilin GspG [Pseudomonas aeruginosa]MCS6532166.1 type II secretion system major pseudopilin GspG [Pseudomonas aeruginosa]MED5156835.1 type II secretion system major pseudopilin GspG [Pseudomonas aeruginosa]